MYGAGPAKLGATLGKSAAVGKRNKDKFMKAYKCYHQLVAALEAQYEKNGGFIHGLDGRKFYVRSKKDTLNTLLQGNSAIIFKNWMIACDQAKVDFRYSHNVELRQILAYHDELGDELYSDKIEIAQEWGKIVEGLASDVGRKFKLKVPIDAVANIGITWEDVH